MATADEDILPGDNTAREVSKEPGLWGRGRRKAGVYTYIVRAAPRSEERGSFQFSGYFEFPLAGKSRMENVLSGVREVDFSKSLELPCALLTMRIFGRSQRFEFAV